jgi:hypothetical protein
LELGEHGGHVGGQGLWLLATRVAARVDCRLLLLLLLLLVALGQHRQHRGSQRSGHLSTEMWPRDETRWSAAV